MDNKKRIHEIILKIFCVLGVLMLAGGFVMIIKGFADTGSKTYIFGVIIFTLGLVMFGLGYMFKPKKVENKIELTDEDEE